MTKSNAVTITLSGSEAKSEFIGYNAWIRNDGTSVIYASKYSGITAGANNVVSIPSGGSAPIFGANGTVFLLGSGSVQLIGSDYALNPFKSSAQSGGSGADEIARVAIETHAENVDLHTRRIDKIRWDGLCNQNLLDNPNFHVNQRGASGIISTAGYFVDRWKLTSGSVKINSDGSLTLNGTITQTFEEPFGTDVVSSANAGTTSYDNSTRTYSLSASGETIIWAKLEHGSVATEFVAPDPTAELAKCQRYLFIYKHQNATSTTDKCTIGVGFALTSSIIYLVLPIAAMRRKINGALDLKDISLIAGTGTDVEYTKPTISEQTDSTLQIAFTVSNQTPGSVYRLRLMNSNAYLAVSKEI